MRNPGEMFERLTVTRQLLLIVGVFAAIVMCLFGLGYLRAQILSGVRAYVGGEGLWSKAEKRAVLSLVHYAQSRSESDYQQYLTQVAVPLGDRDARLEMESPHPDMRRVYQGFVQGRNSPEDVPNLVMLFRRFGSIGYMKQAIAIWREGDGYIGSLRQAAEALHAEMGKEHPDPDNIAHLARQVEEIDAGVTPLEDRFSATLGEGARWINRILFWITLAATAALMIVGVGLSLAVVGQVRNAERERLQAALGLQRNEERFRRLIQNLSDIIAVVGVDGAILYHSPSIERVAGYQPAELLDRNLAEFVHPEDVVSVQSGLAQAAAAPAVEIARDFRFRRKDGSWVWLESIFNNAPDRAAVGGVVVTSRDVTSRRVLEEQVRQSQKMEAVGRLAGGIAHDFNNLLTVIRGYAEIVLQELSGMTSARQNLEAILLTSDRAANMTRQLLSFSRKHIFSPQVLDLNLLVEEMSDMLRRLVGEEIEICLNLDANLGHISADAAQIQQVVLNLAVNARDAMPKGGRLELKTENQDAFGLRMQEAASTPPERRVVLTVKDSGIGMDAETQAHMFEPFFSTKNKDIRTGLGLSVVYNIVTGSGGDLRVQSAPGEGTTFQIFLPRVEAEPAAAPVEPPAASSRAGAETILLAEDQNEVRQMTSYFLKNLGYSVLPARDGAEAVAIAETFDGTIHLLLTDVVMPELRGPDVAQQLAATRPEMKVLYMSGYTEDAFHNANGDGNAARPNAQLLQKPFSLDALAAKIREMLDVPAITI